jgi:cephalosporin-C deacetylase-like acetyl esterase
VAAAQASSLPSRSRPFFPFTALAATVCFMGWRKRRCWHHWLLWAVAYAGLGLVVGCGGGSGTSASSTSTPPVSTSATVTVTATSGTLQGTATISLMVN